MTVIEYTHWSCIGLYEWEFPAIDCPGCDGVLIFKSDSLDLEETTQSNPVYKDYIFTAKYFCDKCGEPVNMTGMAYTDELQHPKKFYPDLLLYTPLFFLPAVNLFRIPAGCPEELRRQIVNSFSLFWSDPYACANKVRVCLELLMDDKGVGSKRFDLNRRIEKFKEGNYNIGNKLKIMKRIGNKGSHAGDIVKVNEVIGAFRLLEESLNELYPHQ